MAGCFAAITTINLFRCDCFMERTQKDMFAAVDERRRSAAERQRQQAEENRRAMPTVAGWIDATRAAFPGAKVAFASEGGKTVGERSPSGVRMSETVIGSFSRGKK